MSSQRFQSRSKSFTCRPIESSFDSYRSIGKIFVEAKSMLAPAYIRLFADSKARPQPFLELKRARSIQFARAGKARVVPLDDQLSDPDSSISAGPSAISDNDHGEAEFVQEYAWVEAFTCTFTCRREDAQTDWLSKRES